MLEKFSALFAVRRAPPRGGFCARQGAELSEKMVRAFSIKDHQIGSCEFLTPSASVRSPRPRLARARLAKKSAVKSYGGVKSKQIFLAEMRRFVIASNV